MTLANIDDTLPIKLFLVITSLIFYVMFCLQLFICLVLQFVLIIVYPYIYGF